MVGANKTYDVCVIGAGVAGLVAASEARSHGLSVCVVEHGLAGGLIANIGAVAGFPAPGRFSGAEIAASLLENLRASGVDVLDSTVAALAHSPATKVIETTGGAFNATQVVVASGATLRRLGVPGETEFYGRGVSQCAFCDAGLFRDADVVVVGGGDGALQEALHLAEYCARVTLIHRRQRLRARRSYIERAADSARLAFKWRTEVMEICGNQQGVTEVVVQAQGKDAEVVPCAGVFVFIGTASNSAFLPPDFGRDDMGQLLVDAELRTSVPGVYAAGAVRSGFPGQITNAMGDGALAAKTLVHDGTN